MPLVPLIFRVSTMSTLAQPVREQIPLNAEVVAGRLLGGGSLVRDYLDGSLALAPFYTGHFGDMAAYHRKAAEVDGRLDGAARARIARDILPLGDAGDRLRLILDGNGYFVTTGQQPALFGGPLYSLYKALSAIRLADALERQLGKPVLAIFWVGADDHDWEEANHAVAIDAQNHVRRIIVDADPNAILLPLSDRMWGPGIERALQEFIELVPRTEFSESVAAHLHEAYTAETTVAASFISTLQFLLRDQRIALVSSSSLELRRAAAPVLRENIVRYAEHATLLAHSTARLETASYHAQVAVAADASNVMLLDEYGRDRLVRSDGGWITRREKRPLSDGELLQRLEQAPEQFSPNVFLRPIVENAVLPTIAYVAGPGEVAYFAQIGCLFDAYDMLPPVVVPRGSITLIEGKVRKVLDKLSLEPTAFARPFQEVVAEAIRNEMPDDVSVALASIRTALQEHYQELVNAASRIDPTLSGPLTAARNNSLSLVAEAEKKITAHLRQRNETTVEQLRKAAANLYPDGVPQERALNPLPLFARYGPVLIPALAAALDLEPRFVAGWSGPECD